ncbi:hypothetical protein F4677DRAFT_430246 [Hypoxylon crocopeplum]|nr:hypothetical protein F4677DRAFT_430246 [Hypoxylon crocopeplum]
MDYKLSRNLLLLHYWRALATCCHTSEHPGTTPFGDATPAGELHILSLLHLTLNRACRSMFLKPQHNWHRLSRLSIRSSPNWHLSVKVAAPHSYARGQASIHVKDSSRGLMASSRSSVASQPNPK